MADQVHSNCLVEVFFRRFTCFVGALGTPQPELVAGDLVGGKVFCDNVRDGFDKDRVVIQRLGPLQISDSDL